MTQDGIDAIADLVAIASSPQITDEQAERVIRTTVQKLREVARLEAGIPAETEVVAEVQSLGILGCADCGGEHEVSSSDGFLLAFDKCPATGNQEQKGGNVLF